MEKDSRLLVKYYRLSLEDQKMGESNSIVNQRKLVEDYVIKREDLYTMPCLELTDDGYTGTNFNRPGIKQFFSLLKADKVACLVVKDFSRFTREYIELGNYAEQIFPFMGVRFISINDEYDSAVQNMDSSLEIPFKGILNELYSRDISMKVRAAKGQLMKDGKLCSGSYPFGYRKAEMRKNRKDEMPYSVDEEAAEVVKFIFGMALEGKKNIEIARALNEKGCLTPAMAKRKNGDFGYGLPDGKISIWDSSKVLKILRDERYTGTLIAGRYQGMGMGSRTVIEKPRHLWICRENKIPVIISRQDFDRVWQIRPVRKRGMYKREHHLLYRKIRCGCCGHFLYVKFSERENESSFFCKQPHLKSESKCFRGYIKEKEVLNLLLTLINLQAELSVRFSENCEFIPVQSENKREYCLKRLEIQDLDRVMIEKWVKAIWVYDVNRVNIELGNGISNT